MTFREKRIKLSSIENPEFNYQCGCFFNKLVMTI